MTLQKNSDRSDTHSMVSFTYDKTSQWMPTDSSQCPWPASSCTSHCRSVGKLVAGRTQGGESLWWTAVWRSEISRCKAGSGIQHGRTYLWPWLSCRPENIKGKTICFSHCNLTVSDIRLSQQCGWRFSSHSGGHTFRSWLVWQICHYIQSLERT